ncbi:arginine--tRNA ligase, partial [bacterium]
MPISAHTVEVLLNQLIVRFLRDKLKLQDEAISQIKSPLLEFPKEASFGDISTTLALKLSALLRRSPRDISDGLCTYLKEEISASGLKDTIEKIDIAGGGFVNFYFSKEYLCSLLKEIVNGKNYFAPLDKPEKKVLVEFVSANPTGPLSVAHGRQAAVGDSLSNILKALGFDVSREYYLNDEGNQINILGNSIALRLRELSGENIPFPEDHYQGGYIIDLARELIDKPQTRSKNPEELKEYCREYGVKRILEIIKKELEDFGVKFDSWYSQKSLGASGKIEKSIAFLKEKGLIYEREGAVWFASTRFG